MRIDPFYVEFSIMKLIIQLFIYLCCEITDIAWNLEEVPIEKNESLMKF